MLFLQAATVELVRGAPLDGSGGGNPGYWAVEDTYLDKSEATQDHGGSLSLLGGDGRTILIRFGDLRRAVRPGRRIVGAKLVLTPSGGEVPGTPAVTAVDSPWGEGPQAVFSRVIAAGGKASGPPRGAATWNERRAGIAGWPSAGKPGGTSITVEGAAKERTYEIAGLTATVEGWRQRPWTNHGLSLSFPGEVEFFSSQSPAGRPRLVLTTEAVFTTMETKPDLAVALLTKTNGRWIATVRNVGSAPAPATKGQWLTDGKPGATADVPALATGAQTTVEFNGSEPKEDLQVPNLAFELTPVPKDPETANDRLDVFTTAKPVKLGGASAQDAIAYWNETVAPQSRFSFAPEGVRGRVRLEVGSPNDDPAPANSFAEALRRIGAQLGLPVVQNGGDLYPGLMGYGDTRFEGTVSGKLALPYEPYATGFGESSPLEATGLLSATDVGRLNDGTFPLPKIALVRVLDLVGRVLPGLDVTLEGPGLPETKLKTSDGGTVPLPAIAFKPDLSNGTLTVRTTANGVTQTDTVKAWRLSDTARRSGLPVVIADVHLNIPMLPLESGTNLADDKPLKDAEGKSYALGSKTESSWIEVDLGRDRTIGEIALKPGDAFWRGYEIRAYSTGAKPEDADLWATERESAWTLKNRSEDGWLVYRAPTERVRFIRIVRKSDGSASLAGLRVVPVKITSVNGP